MDPWSRSTASFIIFGHSSATRVPTITIGTYTFLVWSHPLFVLVFKWIHREGTHLGASPPFGRSLLGQLFGRCHEARLVPLPASRRHLRGRGVEFARPEPQHGQRSLARRQLAFSWLRAQASSPGENSRPPKVIYKVAESGVF